MELRILPILSFLSVALVVSHAALPPEIYWKKMLPNTPMPKAVRNSLLHDSGWKENKGTSVTVGKGGVHVNTGGAKQGSGGTSVNVGPHTRVGVATGKPGGGHTNVNVGPHRGVGVTTGKPGGGHTNVNVGPKSGVGVSTGKPGGRHTNVNVGPHNGVGVSTGKPGGGHTQVGVGPKGGVGVSTGKPGGGHTQVGMGPKGGVGVSTGKPGKGGANVGVGKGGVVVRASPNKKPVYVGVKPGPDPFNYQYAAAETQLHDDPTRALFFLKKDMRPGSYMSLRFTKTTNDAVFLPKEEAESLPLSSKKMSEILQEFSVSPGSSEAHTIESTVKQCEAKGIRGETKYCATSLESMVDYVRSTLGNKVKALSTEVETRDDDDKVQNYKITRVTKVDDRGQAVVCHKQNYPYAVFYCHETSATSPYAVSLVGPDGSTVRAVAVCHEDTSGWNPKHLAFEVLKVKPGGAPVCHFLPEDHIVWVPNN